jgi:heterodisulfide reductase subunit A-like polyferredoxin
LNIELLTYSEVQEVTGEPGNFRVKVLQKPRHIDMSKCTGCGDCAVVTLNEDTLVKEFDGELWVNRLRIDESKCTHCGDCAEVCLKTNPEMQGMHNIVRLRLQEATSQKQIETPTLLQRILRMSQEERKAFWDEEFKKCIKCYGCVDICPVYVDRPDGFDLSKEIPKGEVPPLYPLFHFLRGYNVWDTCVVCGECEKTCPSHIPLKTLQDMLIFLPPEQVFELIPGLEQKDKEKILALVEERKGKMNDAA